MAKAVHTRRERAPRSRRRARRGTSRPRSPSRHPSRQSSKVEEFARSFPGIGPVTAQKIVEACHIRDGRRVSGLGYMQGPRLVEAIKSHMTAKEDGQ